MNKEQSADDPSVDLIRVKNMLNSTISMSYPDVVIACIEHKVSLEAFREAIQEKFKEIIEEISPEKLSQDIGGKGMKIGPMYKASLFDAYEEKYKRLYQFMEKGHLLQEVILVFERKFGNKLIQGERK